MQKKMCQNYFFLTVIAKKLRSDQLFFFGQVSATLTSVQINMKPPGGLPYERDGDAHREIGIKTLKDTNLGVAQALFEP